MLIACPQCSASYEIPPERVPPGREVRCARCITLWTPVPLAPVDVAAAAEAVPDIRPEPVIEAARPEVMPAFTVPVAGEAAVVAPPPGRDWRLAVAWGLSFAVLAGVAWFAVARRDEVMQAWPPSERAYVAVGLVPRR